jgi:hypothetical protein
MSRDELPAGSCDASAPDLVPELARYLRTNPLATDTKEGITQWWLGLQTSCVESVELALGALERAGLIVAVRAADGRVRYRRVSPDREIDERLDRVITAARTARDS